MPFEVNISVLPVRGGEPVLRELFEPLGYTLTLEHHPLDPNFPAWGESRYFTVHLRNTLPLHQLLSHLYILLPVCDNDKHYWVGEHEVEKLLEKGKDWLATHPARELITMRYLKHRRALAGQALEVLLGDEAAPDSEDEPEEKPRILGMDVSHRALDIAKDKLKVHRMTPAQQQRLTFIQGSLTYRDRRIEGFDAAALVEVIEHLDEPRLAALEKIVFRYARPTNVLITTPNAEYNTLFPDYTEGRLRHSDHRFEWTRKEFETWATRVATEHGYAVRFKPVGEPHPEVGALSQMAIFILNIIPDTDE
jgi:hypothetical protein